MLHACFVRSPFARARIGEIDASEALALPGVHAVLTAADINPGVHEAWYPGSGRDIPDSPRPPPAEGEARFVGDPVALVDAPDPYHPADAADLVVAYYAPLAAAAAFTRAADTPEASRRRASRGRSGSAR